MKKVLTNRFIRRIKQAPRALVSKNVHYPFLHPLISALTTQAKTNSRLWYRKEQIEKKKREWNTV